MGKKLEYLEANNIELSKTESNIENNEEKIIKHKNKNDGLKNKIIMKIKSENNKNNLPNKKQKHILAIKNTSGKNIHQQQENHSNLMI